MNRPPRPQIRSSQIIIGVPHRRTTTPQCLFLDMQDQQKEVLKSMRDTVNLIANGLNRSINKTQKIGYMEAFKPQNFGSINVTYDQQRSTAAIGRSFKIRNVGLIKTKTKENSIPIKVRQNKPLEINQFSSHGLLPKQPHVLGKQHPLPLKQPVVGHRETPLLAYRDSLGLSSIEKHETEWLELKSYPTELLNLDEMQSKIGYLCIEAPSSLTQWCLILSQSLFPTPLTSQQSLHRIKQILSWIKEEHPKISTILHLSSDRNSTQIQQILKNQNIPISYIIWNKNRFSQTINSINLSEIADKLGATSYLVLGDLLDFVTNVYFQFRGGAAGKNRGNGESRGETNLGRGWGVSGRNQDMHDRNQEIYAGDHDAHVRDTHHDNQNSHAHNEREREEKLDMLERGDSHDREDKDMQRVKTKSKGDQMFTLVDLSCKYLYVKVMGLTGLIKFIQGLTIKSDSIGVAKLSSEYCDQTAHVIYLQGLLQKMKIFGRRTSRPSKGSIIKQKQPSFSNKMLNEQKTQDLKQKLLSYLTQLESEGPKPQKHRRQTQLKFQQSQSLSNHHPHPHPNLQPLLTTQPQTHSSKSLSKKGEGGNCNAYCLKMGSLFLGLKDGVMVDQGKEPALMVQMLARNNVGLSRQIAKFREKAVDDLYLIEY